MLSLEDWQRIRGCFSVSVDAAVVVYVPCRRPSLLSCVSPCCVTSVT